MHVEDFYFLYNSTIIMCITIPLKSDKYVRRKITLWTWEENKDIKIN